MNTQAYCWSCNQPGGEMLHFGNIHIHNTPECREIACLPAEKHDGNLAGRNPYQMRYVLKHRPYVANVVIGHDIPSTNELWLSPEQAVSLRDWLIQESSELDRLIEERKALRDANAKAGEQ